MSSVPRVRSDVSRRAVLGSMASAVGAAIVSIPAATASARFIAAKHRATYLRELGSADAACSAPGMMWGDFDGEPIAVSLKSTGRPVRLTARVPLEYGGPEGSHVGISLSEDGVDLHHSSELGFAHAQIEAGTIASATLEASMVRQVPAGAHTWTLRVRHENPATGPEAQRTYCRTRSVAPLELTAVEL